MTKLGCICRAQLVTRTFVNVMSIFLSNVTNCTLCSSFSISKPTLSTSKGRHTGIVMCRLVWKQEVLIRIAVVNPAWFVRKFPPLRALVFFWHDVRPCFRQAGCIALRFWSATSGMLYRCFSCDGLKRSVDESEIFLDACGLILGFDPNFVLTVIRKFMQLKWGCPPKWQRPSILWRDEAGG